MDPQPSSTRTRTPRRRTRGPGSATGQARIRPKDEQSSSTVLEEVPELDELAVQTPPRVGIVIEKTSNAKLLDPATAELKRCKVRYEVRTVAAFDDPDHVADYARNARLRGLKVIITGSELSGFLPGLVSAHTDLPVIAVPLLGTNSVNGGLDALLGCVQTPPGTPVATVGVNAAENAAVLAVRILS